MVAEAGHVHASLLARLEHGDALRDVRLHAVDEHRHGIAVVALLANLRDAWGEDEGRTGGSGGRMLGRLFVPDCLPVEKKP